MKTSDELPYRGIDGAGRCVARHRFIGIAGTGDTMDDAFADFWAKVQDRYSKLMACPLEGHTDGSYAELQRLGSMLNALDEFV